MLSVFAFVIALFVIETVRAIHLDQVTIDNARRLDGRRVVVTLIVGTPAYTWHGHTIVGTHEQPDGTDRAVHLTGKRYDVDAGQRLMLVGTLRVIQHKPGFVYGKPSAGRVEVRVVESVR